MKNRIKSFLFFPKKFYQNKILNPNSLIFTHKKETDKYQKSLSRMKRPDDIMCVPMTDEIDFTPGLKYFTPNKNEFIFLTKANNKVIRNTEIETMCPTDCWTEMVIPFDNSEILRDNYRLLHTNTIRSGKLMELLDYFSARVAYKYVNFNSKQNVYTLVTASVDKFEVLKKVTLNKSLVITAYPTWNSESSIEIRIDLSQRDSSVESIQDDNDIFLGSAYFLYVARDAKDYTKKKRVPKLVSGCDMSETEVEKTKLRLEIGEQNKLERILSSKTNLGLIPPTIEESQYLHDIFNDYKQNPSKYKPMIDTKMEKNLLLQSQSQNIHGKLFGGYIMRMALELGFVTAYIHLGCKNPPELICVDRVNFHRPAEIGSIGLFQAMVCFVYEQLIHVSVECYNYKGRDKLLTTTIDLTYVSECQNQLVIPTLYENGLKLLEGKRKMERLFLY